MTFVREEHGERGAYSLLVARCALLRRPLLRFALRAYFLIGSFGAAPSRKARVTGEETVLRRPFEIGSFV
jgi:hypothetical protein